MLAPYRELFGYLKPYRIVVLVGALSGLGFGIISGSIPFLINFVGRVVFSEGAQADLLAGLETAGGLSGWVRSVAGDSLSHVSKPLLVGFACLLIPAVMLLRSLFDFLNSYCSEWTSQKVLTDLRANLMHCLTSQSLDFFHEARAGNLFQRVINETREVQTVLNVLNTQLISQPATLVSGLVVLFRIDWRFTLGALLLLPCCVVPAVSLSKKVRSASRGQEGEGREMMVILHELIAGIKVIKAYSRTGYELDRFNASSRTQFRQTMRVRRLTEITAPLIESLAAVGVALGLYYVYTVGMSGTTFLSLCVGIFLLYQPLKTLSRTQLILARSHVVLESLFRILRQVPSVADAPGASVLDGAPPDIEFRDVTFGYRADLPAVKNISFRFERGKYYALVGASGAGKSTLLSLLMRFYDPTSGTIFFGGHDLRSVTQNSLRDQIGIVTQDTFLFHESIFKNIAYGRLDATREEVIEAARQAHAHDFILAQKEGYDTIVGDKGCLLSGGQQQRLAIARALLKNAPVLLLDEATSALDSQSEQQIQAALETLASGRTVIAIAHRLSTILKADQILVLDQGRVIEQGTHKDLLDLGGTYRKLYDLQFQA